MRVAVCLRVSGQALRTWCNVSCVAVFLYVRACGYFDDLLAKSSKQMVHTDCRDVGLDYSNILADSMYHEGDRSSIQRHHHRV